MVSPANRFYVHKFKIIKSVVAGEETKGGPRGPQEHTGR